MRIAIIGAGVSGLVAAHLLHRQHDITVYEAGAHAGGHTNTIRVDTERHTYHVDTGFIVMNDRNYPNFTRLLDRLDVHRQPTHMSFSVSSVQEDFEFSGTPRGVFCQPRNLLSPRFLRMLAELPRFNRELRLLLHHGDSGESLADFLSRHRFSSDFVERLIVPQVSAVWSADLRQSFSFPVRFMAEFFANHGMLGFRDRPRWSTITGGSARYVEALTRPFHERIALEAPVRSVTRRPEHVEVLAEGRGEPEIYEHVVMATHSDQALKLLSDPSQRESQILGAIPYQPNEAVLHTDSSLLPRRRSARAAWNYHLLREPESLSTVTYYMNHLQRFDADRDFCVTLNRTHAIAPDRVIRKIAYSHPVFTPDGVAAQTQHAAISNLAARTHYCGAYWGWGFHEDGVASALRACAPFGVSL
jgi:predicted NAD/FAD-binding protein